ncbi:MAG: LssY C-terminal domain-containing protein [Bryobacteraceae bacterium]
MFSNARVFALVLAAAILGPRTALSDQPKQPTLKIRLLTGLSSYASKPGAPFTAVATSPYEVEGRVLIPSGSRIYGSVQRVKRVGFGVIHERASLRLKFDYYQTPDGDQFPLDAKLLSVDNAREQVKPDGTIQGILAARNPNGLINGFWYRPDFRLVYRSLIGLTGAADQLWLRFGLGPIGAGAFLVIHCAMFRFPEPEIRLVPGTDMELEARLSPEHLPSVAPATLAPVPDSLAHLVDEQPREVTRPDGRPAPDLVNVVFVGSRDELTEAFLNAGWSTTDPSTLRASARVYSSFSAMQTYRSAPVSKLVYHGAEPDLVFQKSLNTVSKRHHVRIWSAGTFEGKSVWLGAATHDTGVTFRASAVEFVHKIDPDIDTERSKIVDDLLFAGCSPSVGYLQPETPASGTGISTDERIAVLFLETCTNSQKYASVASMKSPGSRLTRLSRRLILETRYYLVREQPYYWGYRLLVWRRSPSPESSSSAPVESNTAAPAVPAVSAEQPSQTGLTPVGTR